MFLLVYSADRAYFSSQRGLFPRRINWVLTGIGTDLMQSSLWFGRGRRPGKRISYSEKRGIEYLARISVKHGIDSDELFVCLIDAWKNKKSKCEGLEIECREKTHDQAIFLLTKGKSWVAQFPLAECVLMEANPLKEFENKMLLRAQHLAKSKPARLKIEDLSAGRKHVTVKARVLKISKPKLVSTRFGFQTYVSNAVIRDETGTIDLSLWNNQVAAISEGDIVQIENGYVASFMGKRQLRIGRRGEINIVEDEEFASV